MANMANESGTRGQVDPSTVLARTWETPNQRTIRYLRDCLTVTQRERDRLRREVARLTQQIESQARTHTPEDLP